ncbi:class I SAM-dependent methyltransferase [Methyloversatilis sp.]|uniref:class I SAM-dependent methyltransferase n=1 Tax=Methyloversatilis sp. TaxID=2569862 RepID=UPI002735648D|nr:class I SAM-dependent methyltransferase [Methyloversatilis sp.]MDP2869890.1 class I SAM-dependent methyltransferase [Methyloversatilis sp.]MDP3287714.1 class I SAM-dependent methyltransferase [Methyloversatilis sp.]MDP3455692.1 class I SAM-dependent methyltransferase [Methyloversatilis sp.]MDP3577553.1 class I SAM-dependent methyltransferase [Methyloversatilis sp.]
MIRLPALVFICTLLIGATVSPVAAQSDRYVERAPSRDGIGKVYMGREISAVMGWQGAGWLERSERAQEERTDLLLTALALKPGMIVADIGAGTGYLSRRLAGLVAPGGKVLAVDVQPQMIEVLDRLVRRDGLKNIEPWLGSETDVNLPPQSVDLAVMVDVYHELSYPYEVLASVLRALRPGGEVVFVEYKAEDPAVPIKPLHKMSEAQIRREASVHALEWVRTETGLPWQHVVVFRKTR